jgi:DME family drug/metabolite transporter
MAGFYDAARVSGASGRVLTYAATSVRVRAVPRPTVRVDDHPLRSRLAILSAAILFSTGGAAIKATHLTGWQVASFRSGVAAVAVWLMLRAARRGYGMLPVAVGVVYAATMVLFVLANKLTTAASTIFLQATAPIYLVVLGPWLLGEPVRRRELVFMASLAVGLALFFVGHDAGSATAPDPLKGNVLAAFSGLSWALAVTGLRFMGRHGASPGGAATAVVLGNVFAFLLCLPFALPVGSFRPLDAAIVLGLGVFQIGLAYVLLTFGLRSVGALEASLLLLAEPVLNPVWAWLIHGERPSAWTLGGGAIIVAATVGKTIAYRDAREIEAASA